MLLFALYVFLFPEGPGRSNFISEWASVGVRSWHKMKSRGTSKKGKLAEHFSSDSHKCALRDYCNLISEGSRIDVLLDKSIRQNLIKENQEREFHKRVLLILLDITRTLCRQGLAFRGAGDGENDNGNFRQIVNLVSRQNPNLKKWLDETALRPRNITYSSEPSQNEFVQL